MGLHRIIHCGGGPSSGYLMYGVVPAAGRGTRLRPLTDSTPKGLVRVVGKPILDHCFSRLLECGVDGLVVIVGYRGEDIIAHFDESFNGMPIQYVWQEKQLGLGHAVGQIDAVIDDTFVVLNGDNVLGGSIEPLVEAHTRNSAVVTALGEQVDASVAATTGVFAFDGDEVVGMVEKPEEPPSTMVSAGCYVCEPSVVDLCHEIAPSETGEYEFSAVIDLLVNRGKSVDVLEYCGRRVNVNTEADLTRAAALVSEN